MNRTLTAAYGLASYLVFFGTFLYLIFFLADAVVPRTVARGATPGGVVAGLTNVGLLALFALQHSGMARRGFKTWITRHLPAATERSTYVLLSSLALILLMVAWRPLPAVVWSIDPGPGVTAVRALFAAGVALILYSTMLIDHFDLFGLRQVVLEWKGRAYTDHPFKTPGLYALVRHPLYVGWLVTMWAAPTMTAGHLLFSAVNTAYILGAIVLEERDLVRHFGPVYEEYRRTTPMLVPRTARRNPAIPA